MQSIKSAARKRRTHRSPEFFIVHSNGRRSKVNSYDFRHNLDAGNLIQSAEQLRSERTAAYVCPGLVAYCVKRDRQNGRTMRVDDDAGGAELTFELAYRLTVQQIEAQLLNQFQDALGARLVEEGRMLSVDPSQRAAAVVRFAHQIAVQIVRERDLAKYRSQPSDWLQWLRNVIRGGFLAGRVATELRAASLPLLKGEPVIPGDPETAFALY